MNADDRPLRKGLLTALGLAAAVAALPAHSREPPPRAHPRPRQPSGGGDRNCEGRWVGVGRGSTGEAWTIEMVVTEGNSRCGTIEYPSLGCGGYLEQCARGQGGVHYVENYTHNPGTCAPAGTIDAVCSGDTMRWTWRGIEEVTATLHRQR